MALRYKGKPNLGANRIVDAWADWCRCRFMSAGYPMDQRDCKIHDKEYPCDQCACPDYRPRCKPIAPECWPLCVCGHIPQEHN